MKHGAGALRGRLFTSEGAHIIDDGIVAYRDGTVLYAGTADGFDASQAEIETVGDAVILPGLVDAHNHVCLEPGDEAKQMEDPVPLKTIKALNRCRVDLISGVTTMRCLGDPSGIDLHIRDGIAAGLVVGPRLVVAGSPVCRTGGHGWSMGREADGTDEVRKAVREQIKKGADCIKIMVTGGRSTRGSDPLASEYTYDEVVAAAEEAHRAGRRIAAHVHGGVGARYAVEAGIDTLEHGTFIDDVDLLREVREKGIWLVVNMWNTNPRRLRERDLKTSHPPFHLQRIREAAQAAFKNFRMFLEHGIPVAVGADCHHGRMAWQIESMVEAGMAPLLALRAATIGSACACGLGGEVGSLAAGKTADIVVCSGDLERDIGDTLRSVRMVVKCGTTVVRDGRVVA